MIFLHLTVISTLFVASQAVRSVDWSNVSPIRAAVPTLYNAPRSRIIGGTVAGKGQIPFQVGYIADKTAFCGGSLISDTLVLTVAHCLQNYSSFVVYLGSRRVLDPSEDGRVVLTTTDKKLHEAFDFGFGLNNDIGLLRLPQAVTFTATIKPILLPSRRDLSSSFAGRVGTTSGWGKDSDESSTVTPDLQYVSVSIVANAECEAAYGVPYVPATKLCISTDRGTHCPCHGDSGGPLYLSGAGGSIIQVGVVSFGATAGCESGFPMVYTRLTSFVDWIARNGGPSIRP